MAFAARRGRMSSGEWKASFLMTRQRECGWLEALQGVAQLALVPKARILELAGVSVFVAIKTLPMRYLVASVFALRDVTLSAFHRRVFAGQRIIGSLMHAHGEQRRLECILVVTTLAILAAELALVWIRRVAVRAQRVRDRLLEVAALVAIVAAGFGVGSVEWKRRLVVIESGGGAHRFPA